MAGLPYSSRALDVLPLFHRKRFVIYVEGRDDIHFWNIVLGRSGLQGYELKPAGGAYEIDRYMRSIIADDADIVVARDCDYTDLLGLQCHHARILYTYGYSFENSLYCPESIAAAIDLHARTIGHYAAEASVWLAGFVEKFKLLIIYDIANERYGRGMKVLGDNCNPFLVSSKSCSPCESKIASALATFQAGFTVAEIAEVEQLVKEHTKELLYIVKGHFLDHAVINYIKSRVRSLTGKSLPLTRDNLYALMMSKLETVSDDREDFRFIKKQVDKLAEAASAQHS